MIRLIVASVFFLLAAFVFVTEVLGLFRFRYVLDRMHAAALGDTLGILLVVLGVIVLRGGLFPTLKLLLIPAFLFLTSPVVTHTLAEAEVLNHGCPNCEYEEEDRTCCCGEKEDA